MRAAPFRPSLTADQPCWTCTAYQGPTAGGTAALCGHPGSARVRASPDLGCCSWERELGTDDEPGRLPDGFLPIEHGARVWRAKEAPPRPVVVEWAP